MDAGGDARLCLQMREESGVATERLGAAPTFYVAFFLRRVHSVLVLENVSAASGYTILVHCETCFS